MFNLEINTNIGCQINCKYCPQDKLKENYKKMENTKNELEINSFLKYIEKIPSYVNIDFCGMYEPFFNKDIIKFILATHKKGHNIRIYTTGFGMKEEYIKVLKEINFKKFVLHLPDNYMKTKVNKDYIKNLILLLKNVKNIDIVSFGENNKSLVDLITNKLNMQIEYMNYSTRAGNLSYRKKYMGKIDCARHFSYNVLLPNGKILLCCMDYSLENIIGDLNINTYTEILNNNEVINNIRKGLNNGEENIICRKCDMFAIHS